MKEPLLDRVVTSFNLTPPQRAAALERQRDIVLTAGAGSGKTRTLIARYAGLLAGGLSPRRVVAITFTEKAAREMRSRVRTALGELAQNAVDPNERQRWVELGSQMDSARIGTIHSLCAEILRAHPAEAGNDPRFEVLDEGLAAALRVQVVTDTSSTLVELPDYAPLFQHFRASGVQALLGFLLNRRLEARETFLQDFNSRSLVLQSLESSLRSPEISEPLADLRAMSRESLTQNEGENMASMLTDLLVLWCEAESALVRAEPVTCAGYLFQARREKMRGNIGKRVSPVRDAISALKTAFDALLNPLTSGAGSKDSPPDAELEDLFEQLQPLLRRAFDQLLQGYQSALNLRHALDFDDLEYGALQLLKNPAIRARWQSELDALLVDEFQDTNARQRELVEALSGPPGRLFLVGDARQSIYRFRRADVTVFRAVQERVRRAGGLVLDLDITYRAHEPLLLASADLLSIVMGTQPDPARPYHVPFSPLSAYRKIVPEHISGPHVEIVLGVGAESASARQSAARALAERLLELKAGRQIQTWDQVALLFRASTGFAAYEDAFEESGLPFVTVAGRGFYDRPEIRDVLNLLRALSDPSDDLCMAGLLRSPAFGLSDAALYQLRLQGTQVLPYWAALRGDLSMLNEVDNAYAQRAARIISELLPMVDRVPVAELLKCLVDACDYRALLAADDSTGSGGRQWRNLDKLLGDAQSSQQVNVRDFLEYLATLNDAGAREGEAPAEAQGAVRLMTIHKSKGLEFPVVVLADAGREPRGASELAYLLPGLGFAFKLDPAPMLYRLASQQDQLQSQAETRRLLYVAVTRAQEKLIISGHAAPARSGSDPSISAWLSELCAAAGLDLAGLLARNGAPLELFTSSGQPVRAWCAPAENVQPAMLTPGSAALTPELDLPALYRPLYKPAEDEDEERQARPVWRATAGAVPPSVIGKMVHKAIELWLFPTDARLILLLEAAALNAGLASQDQRSEAVRRARELLERFQMHPLWQEIDSALERHHEIPYSRMVAELAETGYIDLLYRTASGWQLLDFKTDAIHNLTQRQALVGKYARQMQRYTGAVESLLGAQAQARMCFLDDMGRVALV